jgi:GT2 family glycosyltransferase
MREVANEEFDYLFIVDSDIYVPKNWDKKMVDFMERNKKIGLAGPSTNYAGSPQLVKDCPELKTDKEIEEFALEFDKRNGHSVVPWQWPVIGFCQIIRKEVFDKVGYFDETFKLYGCEDNDYCWRIQQLGWNLAYINNIFIYHHGHGGFDLLDGSGIDQWGKNRDYFKEKHGWI